MTEAAPRWTRLEHDERRSQIVAVARRLFSERRYSAVSTQEIADAAGVARGLLHHYFGSKHELFLEAAREMLRVPTLPLPAADDLPGEELWERSVDGWLDLMDANREMWLNAVRAGETGHDPALRGIMDEASEAVVERVLEVLGRDPDDVPPEVRAVVRAYGGLAQEATREWLERSRLSREQVRILLVGVMPLVDRELLPAIVAAGRPPKRRRRS
jgi:AcrR family transcriptional regulator